jgi:hypothetical protein
VSGCFMLKHGYMEDDSFIGPCQGQLRKAHLIPKQMIKRELPLWDPWHPALWVPCCGGMHGNAGHHGAFDYSKRLRLRRESLPVLLERIVPVMDEEVGREVFASFLDREYGPRVAVARANAPRPDGRGAA